MASITPITEERLERTVFGRIEATLGIAPVRSDIDLAKMVDDRLPAGVVGRLIDYGLTEDEIYQLVIPRRTLSHRRSRAQSLTCEESDRAVRIARITALAESVFDDRLKSLRWLRKPKRRFEDRSPLDMLLSEAGARLVEELLYQIEEGMAA